MLECKLTMYIQNYLNWPLKLISNLCEFESVMNSVLIRQFKFNLLYR